MLEVLKELEEQSRFSLLFKIVQSKSLKFVSDDKDYIIAQSDKNMPIWVWNSDEINEENLKNLVFELEEFWIDDETYQITAKETVYHFLLDNKKLSIDNYFEMGSYYCKNTIEPKKCEGKLELATLEDVNILARYRIDELKELENKDGNYDEIAESITNNIINKCFYIWKDNKNKIVCTAVLNISDQFARINKVYTPVAERCKGYAKNIIYQLTNLALRDGYIPVLYTDYNYPASNKAYKDVGYEDLGRLINFSIQVKR